MTESYIEVMDIVVLLTKNAVVYLMLGFDLREALVA